ncbi:Rhophilin-2 [Galemys pyrenaicus]|uniref:Rhophilin-2 n=1 Tax=Galemys pyrenaicus TaxID=202257 RepID=A0A8J5ZVA3_GALPY|nr:Rhophilin-2 [Galemys pyrenaicus]
MTDTLLPAAPQPLEKEGDCYFRKVRACGRAVCGFRRPPPRAVLGAPERGPGSTRPGGGGGCPGLGREGRRPGGCNPLAQTGRSKLQNQRAALNQQILKAVRMRTGAENLLKVATNQKVREQVRLELSFLNSDLQILKEELEGLNISVGVYQSAEEAFTIPLIPLGLKETKDVDFSVVLKDFILDHYSEDGYLYEDEIADLMDLRQACRTPSRDEAGVELLMTYFTQLGFVESRFFPPTRQMGILFTWYDSLTGVPVSQQNLLLEKASVLFNIGALYTQIGTRCNRQAQAGLESAVDAFQRAAGASLNPGEGVLAPDTPALGERLCDAQGQAPGASRCRVHWAGPVPSGGVRGFCIAPRSRACVQHSGMFCIFASGILSTSEQRGEGTRSPRNTQTFLITGVLNHLKETFTHTPSYDMSPAMLGVLVKMMLAQAQESVFEKICLPGIQNEFFVLVKVAQEAAKVSALVPVAFGAVGRPTGQRGSPRHRPVTWALPLLHPLFQVGEVYQQLHAAMSQAPVKENIPYSWARLACVKAHHYGALAHYFTATLLIDHRLKPGADEDHQEKCLSQLYDHMPEGLTPLATLKDSQQRQQLGACLRSRACPPLPHWLPSWQRLQGRPSASAAPGCVGRPWAPAAVRAPSHAGLPLAGKSHLLRAIALHEESVREASLCRKLRSIEVLPQVLSAAHQRSRRKYAQHEEDDDLLNLGQAPDILSKTEQEVEIIPPQLSRVTVTDFFQKLGPLSVFSANKRWTPPRSIQFTADEGDLGFTLKGNSPVQVHCLDPYCSAALAGAKEGDYIVAIQSVDCKWLTVTEVMKLLKNSGEDSIEMKVVSLLDPTSSMHSKCATYSVGMQKTYSMICLAMENDDDKTDKNKKISKKLSFLSWGTNKNRQKSASTLCLPSVGVVRPQVKKKLPTPFSLLNSDSSLY